MSAKYYKYIHELYYEVLRDPDYLEIRNKIRDVAYQAVDTMYDRETILIMGGDKAGKSIVVHSLLENTVSITRGQLNPEALIIKKIDDGYGPEIGLRPNWQCRVPTMWSNRNTDNKVLMELPGQGKFSYRDQEKLNQLLYPILFCCANRVKFIMVWNCMDILSGSFQEYLEQINFLDKLFDKHFPQLMPGFNFVISKVPGVYNGQQVDSTFIMKCIDDFIQSNQSASRISKRILADLIARPQRIMILKKPTAPGATVMRFEQNERYSLLHDNFLDFEELAFSIFIDIPLTEKLFYDELENTIGIETYTELEECVMKIAEKAAEDKAETVEELEEQLLLWNQRYAIICKYMKPHYFIRKKLEALEAVTPLTGDIVYRQNLYQIIQNVKVIRTSVRLSLTQMTVIDKCLDRLLKRALSQAKTIILNLKLQIRIMKEQDEISSLREENESLEQETNELVNMINTLKQKELKRRRRSIFSRVFRSSHKKVKVFRLLKIRMRPVMVTITKFLGVHHVARGIKKTIIAVIDYIDRERELFNY